MELSNEDVTKEFQMEEKQFNRQLLANSLRKMAPSADDFIKLRTKFLKNYSVLSICSYILGVGDRHLDNFLFNYKTGDILPIDFGYSFGFAIGLNVPELIPFRLTQNFQELCHPLGISGVFRNSMIYALRSLRISTNNILDCCEVFVRDPLIDWIKSAKNKEKETNEQVMEGNPLHVPMITEIDKFSWYPRRKIDIVEKKLRGYKCTDILIEELKDTRHWKENYIEKLKDVVSGDPRGFRYNIKKKLLPIGEQVDCLLDLAQDPNILGRTWTYWSPYA